MHLKRRRKKNNTLNKITLLLIIIIILVIYLLHIFNKKALPQLISYSEIETKKIISSIISSTVMEEISNTISDEDLFITSKDNTGSIKSIDFNSKSVNKILAKSARLIEKNLKYLENGNIDKLNLENNYIYNYDKKKLKSGIIYELPSGIIFNNIIFNNLLPKIPIKIDLIGNIFCKLNTDINSYGINNALIKVNITVTVDVKILLPFVSKTTQVTTDIPIIMKIIEGNVPSYYYDGYLSNPSITKEVE